MCTVSTRGQTPLASQGLKQNTTQTTLLPEILDHVLTSAEGPKGPVGSCGPCDMLWDTSQFNDPGTTRACSKHFLLGLKKDSLTPHPLCSQHFPHQHHVLDNSQNKLEGVSHA